MALFFLALTKYLGSKTPLIKMKPFAILSLAASAMAWRNTLYTGENCDGGEIESWEGTENECFVPSGLPQARSFSAPGMSSDWGKFLSLYYVTHIQPKRIDVDESSLFIQN